MVEECKIVEGVVFEVANGIVDRCVIFSRRLKFGKGCVVRACKFGTEKPLIIGDATVEDCRIEVDLTGARLTLIECKINRCKLELSNKSRVENAGSRV